MVDSFVIQRGNLNQQYSFGTDCQMGSATTSVGPTGNRGKVVMMAPQEKTQRAKLAKLVGALRLRLDDQIENEYNVDSFVPLIHFGTLAAPNTQIIYGRNGTGKTHLLKAFHQHCRVNFATEKVLPVYIDLKTFGLSTIGGQLDLKQLIHRYYRLFVAAIVDALIQLADETLTEDVLEKIFGGEVHDKRKRIKQNLMALHEIFDARRIEEGMTKYARKVETSRESNTGIKAGLSVSVSGFEPKAKTEIGLSAEEIDKNKDAVELIFGGLAVIDYDEIRQALEGIIDECGARAICVLVDEWSSIELKIQPILAEMIRKTLCVSNRIFVKIVALKFFTRTSASLDPPQVIGFQPGIDIFPVADLDTLLCFDFDEKSQQSVKDFLTLVLYRHCAVLDPDIKAKDVAEFEKHICDHVFESPEAYLEIVRASEGNPRDFLSLLTVCCNNASQGTASVSQRNAVRIASSHFSTSKAPILQDDPAEKLYRELFEKVVQNKRKLFLLSAAKAGRDARIQKLWHYRFIHLVVPTYTVITDSGIPKEYSVFSMDYGKLLALKTHKEGEKAFNAIQQLCSFFDPGIVASVLSAALEMAGLKENLISVAGTILVGKVETADLDEENLVKTCVYDGLL